MTASLLALGLLALLAVSVVGSALGVVLGHLILTWRAAAPEPPATGGRV